MWPLTRKRSLRFAVLKRIAVCKPFISRSNGMGCRSNGLSYPFKNNYEPFERLELSVQKKIGSRSNGWSYPFKKNWELFRMAWAIRSKKIGSRSNGWSYTFQKSCEPFELDVRGERLAICFETVAYNSFGRDVSSRDPVKVNSLRTAISQEYIGQTKVSLE